MQAEAVTLEKPSDGLSDRDHRRIAEFIEGTAGIQLPLTKKPMVEGRLRKRQRKLGYPTLHAYIDATLAEKGKGGEKNNLLDALTTNKTSFFREPEHFSFLISWAKAKLLRNNFAFRNHPLNIWSAGCSSGNEAYTLAMLLTNLKDEFPDFSFKIWATDISTTCLEKGTKATYRMDDIVDVPFQLRKKFILRSRNRSDGVVKDDMGSVGPFDFAVSKLSR